MRIGDVEGRQEEKDAIALLESVNIETADCEDLRNLCKHLRIQFKSRYRF